MKFGFYLPTRGPTASADALETFVTRAEASGFNSVMIADHAVFPVEINSKYPYTVSGAFPGHGDALDVFSLMSFVAAKTRRLRMATSVMIVPYRNPVLTAKSLATIDVLSGGRVTVGVGVGWLREEFEALDTARFEDRGPVTDEYIRIFKNLWTEDPASYSGEYYSYKALHCLPHPIQKPHPPIWIGGHSMPALRRVARLADGWHPVGANPAVPLGAPELKEKLDVLRGLTDKEGRNFDDITICYKAPVYDLGSAVVPGEVRRPFTGQPDQVLEDIQAFADLGVSELVFDFRSETLTESLDRMGEFTSAIIKAQ